MVDLNFDPAVDVTQECVRRRFRRASCRACADVCPAQVFSFSDTGVLIEKSLCVECGDCLFVCPTEAITGIAPRKRFLKNDTLAGPFTARAATIHELLLWHAVHGVRFISLEAEQYPAWMAALAGLNLVLRRRGETVWGFKPWEKYEVNVARRALIHIPQEDVTACAVQPGKRAQRAAFPDISEADIVLNAEKCMLCGACWRSCSENAIRFEQHVLIVEAARCTGCGGCEAVCQHHALEVTNKESKASITTYPTYAATCTACHRPFWSFHPDQKQCALCLHHPHGMRNPDCC